jgi:hypothetical protein
MEDKAISPSIRNFPFRVIDSALLIAIVLGVLQYAGSIYRQAYLKSFSIDPSSLDSSSIAVAVEGVGAIKTTIFALAAGGILLIATAIATWAFIRWVEHRRGNSGPVADRTAVRMIQAGGIVMTIVIVLTSGTIAGRRAAAERFVEVGQGEVWNYHLKRETLSGVPVAQGKDTTWLLTKAGIRLVRTAEIRLIDGPLFERLARKSHT